MVWAHKENHLVCRSEDSVKIVGGHAMFIKLKLGAVVLTDIGVSPRARRSVVRLLNLYPL